MCMGFHITNIYILYMHTIHTHTYTGGARNKNMERTQKLHNLKMGMSMVM